MHDIAVQVINALTSPTASTVYAYLGGSTLVAAVVQLVKHKFIDNPGEAKKLITFLLGFFSFIAAFADFIVQTTAQNPLALGRNTAFIVSGAVFIHRFAVSPVYSKIVLGLTSLVADATAYRVERAATPEVPTFQV